MTKFVAVVSGKGGVGKTTTTINVGHALSNLDRKVLLLDANLATPNLAIQLGFMNPKGTVNKFLNKEKTLREVTYKHESGLSLIPASPSYLEYQKTEPQKMTKMFVHLENMAEFVLIDSPSGLNYEVSQILKNSDETLIVVNPNLSSVMDALKTIKVAKTNNCIVAGIILNMTRKGKHELKPKEIEKILGHHILVNIKHDKKIKKTNHKGIPLASLYKRSKSAKKYKQVAEFISLEKELKTDR